MSSLPCDSTLEDRAGAAIQQRPGQNGVGRLRFSPGPSHTTLTHAYASSPLKLLNPRSHGRAAWVYTSTYGGGLVGGDAIQLDIEVEEGAAAFVTTQASTKVYRSPLGASQSLTARIADGAVLVTAPDPVVVFAGAAFAQEQTIDVETGGTLVLVDSLVAGRVATGERWAFDAYRTRLRIRRNGALLLHDAVYLDRDEGNVANRFDRFNVLLVAVLLGPAVRDTAAAILSGAAPPVTRRPNMVTTTAPLGPDGVVMRMVGVFSEDVTRAMRAELSCVSSLLGADPWARKW